MNILLVEDDPTDVKLLSAVLHAGGHRVFCKGSAEQAEEEVKARRPDVILLDLKLPGMDGLDLARLLKNDPATQEIPIIAITAAFEQFSQTEAFAAGCNAFIPKPIDTRKLPLQVADAVSKTRTELSPT